MILAIDQGTSSTKATLFNTDGGVVTSASVPLGQQHPRPGWVEQDAIEIADGVRTLITNIAKQHEVSSLALATQRESAVVWERASGEPVSPMLGWQDRRTTARATELGGAAARVRDITGLPLDPMFSALKIQWILDQVDPNRSRSLRGELAAGTVDSWLLYCLTGEHRIEAGNASRTQLVDLTTVEWSAQMCELFHIPAEVLPRIVASNEPSAELICLPGRRVDAVFADSHAALFGHGVWEPGTVKTTYGTGASVMGLISDASEVPEGLVGTIAWRIGDSAQTAFEGNILASGATLSWVARLTGRSEQELAERASEVPDGHGVTLVPAMAGLGAPHWDPTARAVLTGFDLGTTPAILARAAMEAQTHQVADILEAAARTIPLEAILVDGGPSRNDFLMQLQADIARRTVCRPPLVELSARGAAWLAARSHGYTFTPLPREIFTPRLNPAVGRDHWAKALTKTKE